MRACAAQGQAIGHVHIICIFVQYMKLKAVLHVSECSKNFTKFGLLVVFAFVKSTAIDVAI